MKFIAEIGWNFIGDMTLARQMVECAASSGADIAKFQLWDPRFLKSGSWDSDGRREIYNRAALDDQRLDALISFCEDYGVGFLTSVFELRSLKRVLERGCKEIKIPSHECTNFPLIDGALEAFDRIYLSIGAVTNDEFDEIVSRYGSVSKIVAMHCLSAYPAAPDCLNLHKISLLKNLFGSVGYSSHFQGIEDAGIALALGAKVIEKHFTVSNDLPGRDNKFALDPVNFKLMIDHIQLCKSFMEWRGTGLQSCEQDVYLNMRGRWDK